MADMCPHCGYNLAPDQLIEAGRWVLSPTETFYDGERLDVTKQQAAVLHTLAKARGVCVPPEVIKNRVSDSERGDNNIVYVLMRRLRMRLPSVPFERAYGVGFRWKGDN